MITLYNEKGEKLKLISVFEFNDADMSESSISATVSFSEVQDFHPDWYVVYNGEKFYLGVKKPTGKKDTSSLSTSYTLVFKSERENLKRFTFMDFVELGSDNPQPSSYKVSLYATLTELVDRFNLNLRYYLGNRWQMVLPQGYVEDGNAVSVSFDNASLWDVLLRFYEIYGVRWVIRSVGDVLQIQVGFEEVELEHVFEYGKDNGLVSVERNNSLERIITRLRGRGSEKNLPPDYFHSGDPDTNTSLQSVFFKNLMPKAYRDYIRGYNAGSGSGTWSYNQGVADKKQGKAISPVDYALSDKEDLWGISYGAIEPNEKIFPTLQGATRNGVRLDEVLAVEKVLVDGIREPQNTIAVKIGPGGSEDSIGTCGTTPKYIDDCRNGINYSLNTDKFAVSNPINKLQVRLTAIPSVVNSEGLSEPTQFSDESTVHITAVLSLMDFSKNITGEAIRTYTVTDVDTFLWELEDVPIGGEYRLRADITWSARILKEEADEQGKPTYTDNSGVVVSISSGLTGATVWEYAREEDKGDWKETFDIEIRDVWGIVRNADESDEDYTYRVWEPRAVSEDMTVMFSDGLLAGEDYEFRIVGFNSNADDLRQTIITAIKPTAEGGWKLTLQKSDAELNAGNIYLPNTQQNAKPGDHFFFVNISMPYDPYVYDAEARLGDYLDEQLAMKDEEFPSFTITPSKIFCSSFSEVDKIKAGAKIRVKNVALIGDSYISLYIQSLTKRYSANSLNPEWNLTLSDLVVASGNPVETLEGQVNVLTQRVYSNRTAVQEAVRSLSSTFVRKDGIADVSYSPTEFKKKIELGEGIADKGFLAGDSQGQGFGVYTDNDGNRVIEADVLVGRIGARFNEVQINQVSYSAGKQVFSAAGMVVSKVEDAGTSWRCYFDAKNGTVRNYFTVNDGAFSQRFTDAGVRQYWARVVGIGADYIEISKTDRMQGSSDPLVGDNIAQLGNSTDKSRQAALVIDETHEGGGLVTWYDDIIDFTLSGKDSVNIGRVNGKTSLQVYGSGYIGDRGGTQYVRYEDGKLKVAGTLEVGTKLGDGMTVVEDGIVQSMLVKLGYVKDDVFQVMSGTNGLYDGKKLGGGIAAWYGGPMVDKEADKGVVDFAQSLFRFDGSGYLASGNITWDKDGAGHVAGGDLSWDKDGVITLGSSIKISGDVDNTLGSILEYVNELRRLWRFDKENNAVYTPLNLIVEGTIGMGDLGEGGSGEVATPNITIKFYDSEIPYTPDANGIITLPAYPEGGGGSGEGGITQVTAQMIEEALGYVPYSSKNPSGYITNAALNGYATEQWVKQQGYLTQHQDLSAYAKSADVASTYATKTALQTLQNEHNALSTKVTNLDNLLNSDVSGVINTWGEVVDFLNEYSGSDDLATILAGMNNDIANRVLVTDFEKLEDAVDGIAGYFTNGSANNALKLGGQLPSYYATKSALDTTNGNVVSLTQRMGTAESGISTNKTNIATLTTDLSKLTSRVSTAEGTIKGHTDAIALNTNNIASNAKSIVTNATAITAVSNRVQKFEDVLGIDSNGDVYIKGTRNFYTEGGTIGMAGLGSGGSGGGGGTAGLGSVTVRVNGQDYITDASGIVTIPNYPTSLPASDVYAWAKAATKPTYTASEVGALSVNGGILNGNININTTTPQTVYSINNDDVAIVGYRGGIGAWLYNDISGSYLSIADDGTPIYNGYAIIHSGNYSSYALPLSGGTLTGDLALSNSYLQLWADSKLYGFNVSASSGEPIYLKDNAWYTLLHSGNYSSYALPLSGGTITGALKLGTIGELWYGSNGEPYFKNLSNSNYINIGGDGLYWNNTNIFLHSGNYSSYALPLSGGKMTGTITVGDFTAFGQTGGNFYLGTPAYPLLLRSNGTTTINGNTLIHSGNYSSYALPLSGGTISSGSVGLYIQRDANPKIGFNYNSTTLGFIGFNTNYEPIVQIGVGVENTLIHSGNYADYAYPKDGRGYMSIGSNGRPVMVNNQGYGAKNTAGTTEEILWLGSDNITYVGGTTSKRVFLYDNSPSCLSGVLIHSGNIGSQSVNYANDSGKLGGTLAERFLRAAVMANASAFDANSMTDDVTIYKPGGDIGSTAASWQNFPVSSAPAGGFSLINIKEGNYNRQIYGGYNSQSVYIRSQYYSGSGSTWNAWRAIAFTDSNVASATKLQTARTIWGQSFDGTQDVNGRILVNDDAGFYHRSTDGNTYYAYVGGSVADSMVHLYNFQSGGALRLYNDGRVCIPSGNVLIGTTVDSGYKLDVAGNARVMSIVTEFNDEINRYGGCLYLQHRGTIVGSQGDARTSGIIMCANGGNVLIGSGSDNGAKLQVVGDCTITGTLSPTYGIYNAREMHFNDGSANRGIFRGSYWSSAYSDNDLYFRIDNSIFAGNLTVTGDITSEGTMAMAKLASSSDRKLKANIAEVSAEQSMGVIRQLRPTTWNWIKDGKKSYGFIAQDVQSIVPEMVSSVNDTLRLEYNQLHAFEIGAIQHIDSEVDKLKKDLAIANGRIEVLENELKQYRRNA